MVELVLDIPIEKRVFDEKLFEVKPIRRARILHDTYTAGKKKVFHSNIKKSKPLFSFDSAPKHKQVVVKNIGNMKKVHLGNALNYIGENSNFNGRIFEYLNSFDSVDLSGYNYLEKENQSVGDLFNDRDNLIAGGSGFAMNHLGEIVNLKSIMNEWKKDFSADPNTNEAMHLVFSVKEPHSEALMDILLDSARNAMGANLSEYKYVLVPHSHQNNPHIHIVLNKKNIFTNKYLHFDNKNSCAEFFNILREDFKNNLYELSNGKLIYENNVKLDENFTQNALDSKIEIMNKFVSETSNFNLKDDSDFFKMYNEAYDVAEVRFKSLHDTIEKMQKDLKNQSIYRRNLIKKIEALKSENKPYDKLELTLNNLNISIDLLRSEIKRVQNQKDKIYSDLNGIDSWKQRYEQVVKNFDTYNKKKAIVISFKGYERFLSKATIAKLNHIKHDVRVAESEIYKNVDSVTAEILKKLSSYNEKTNVFVLSKNISKLMHYKSLVYAISFDESERDKKDKLDKVFDDSEFLLFEAVARRHNFIMRQLDELESEHKKKLKMLENMDFDSKFSNEVLLLGKKLDFLKKERELVKQIYKKYNVKPRHLARLAEKDKAKQVENQYRTDFVKNTSQSAPIKQNIQANRSEIKRDVQHSAYDNAEIAKKSNGNTSEVKNVENQSTENKNIGLDKKKDVGRGL